MAAPYRDQTRIKGDTYPVVGHSRTIWTNFTRPNDTTQYAAGDQVCNSTSAPTALTFANVVQRPGECVTITGAVIVDSANQATKPNLELWLFTSSPTMANDNAAIAVTDANLQGGGFIGVIRLNSAATKSVVGLATSGAGGNCILEQDEPVLFPVALADGVSDVYGFLVERGTYTPVAQERFDIGLRVLN